MSENLNVDTFRNGDSIPQAKSIEEWILALNNKQSAYCYFNNHKIQDDPQNGDKYGKLYNCYAVKDKRELSPKGWHIPSYDEWTMLTNQLGGRQLAKYKVKSTYGWYKTNGSDSVGFNALPGGFREEDGRFHGLGFIGIWWCSSDDYIGLLIQDCGKPLVGGRTNDTQTRFKNKVNRRGFSVRCVKD